MKDEHKEAYTMITTAAYFLKESHKYKMPDGVPSKVSQIIGWLEELKQDIKEAQ